MKKSKNQDSIGNNEIMRTFTEFEKTLLNRIQKDIKITIDPLKDLADEMDISIEKFLDSINSLKNDKIIRDIVAIFSADKIGYHSSLIAFEVSKNDIEAASETITEHPGVSHNYLRDHRYNIWFTIALDSETSLEEEVSKLAQKSNANDFLILKNEKLLKIGLMLNVGNENENNDNISNQASHNPSLVNRSITEEEKKAVYLLQKDLPLTTRPFKDLIDRNNIDIDEKRLVEIGKILKKDGIMRRYSAILKHQKAGYSVNAMTAWKLENNDENSDTVRIFSSIPNISHLYFRTIYPGKWEHPLFAMIHAKTDDELNGIIKDLEKRSGIKDYLVLHSLKEFKKKRVTYFSDKFK